MVLLTMTPALVAALEAYKEDFFLQNENSTDKKEPTLDHPAVGNPISHGQIIGISKTLRRISSYNKASNSPSYHLQDLLRGSSVYVPPPLPKIEPTSEYKELMARLKREEEARAYDRMTHATPRLEDFSAKTPSAAPAVVEMQEGDDEMTYADVNRQMMLILNVLVSIIACGIAIWLVARHWNAPSRLALSLSGSGAVGVAEVVIYAGYIRRLKEAKIKERSKKERKQVVDTWVTDLKASKVEAEDATLISTGKHSNTVQQLKFRGKKP